jgi:beta-glucosidase
MKSIFLVFAFLLFVSKANCQSQFIKDLIAKMKIEDKCGQMTQVTFDVIAKNGPLPSPDENPIELSNLTIAIRDKRVGSILNTPYNTAQKASTWQKIITTIQDQALTYNLKIPILYGLDSIHGANYIQESTLFPQPLSM